MQLSSEQIQAVNRIFRMAQNDQRQTLYEHEVYEMLRCIGLGVPAFVFVTDPQEVTEALLQRFGHEIVVKIVSAGIAHKQKLGGVKKVNSADPLFVQFVLEKMAKEVLSHFADGDRPRISGFLLVEFLPYSQSLGYEVLIGAKEDPAFGPVLTISKGGDDAEFFSTYYDPANLFLPLLDDDESLKMVRTLKIRHKFEQIGHPEYCTLIGKAVSAISHLADACSFVAKERPDYILKAIDVNPFVITADNRFTAIDGFAEFEPTPPDDITKPAVNLHNLDGFFNPRGVAIIGVSGDMSRYSLGRDVAQLLHDLKRDDLYLVNPKGGSLVIGSTTYPFYKSMHVIPDGVDLVVYAAPARTIFDFMRELPENPPKCIILIPGIPSDVTYAEFTRRLDEVKPAGMRVIGPNCMGVFFAPEERNPGLNTLFMEEERLKISSSEFSNTLLLTQSGAFSVTAIDTFQHSRIFKSVVSFGNKYDVKITDLLGYFMDNPLIEVIALYIEGFNPGEGWQFYDLARRCTKPIIAYKAGKTDAGAKAAASHTASMSGSYDVFKAACMQAGVILVENIEDHYDFVKVFSLLHSKIPSRNRVAGVVNAGFESTVGADELKNLEQAQLSQATISRLGAINRFGLADTHSPFLDISPMADDRMYADFVEAVMMDENVDCVFVSVVPHPISLKTSPETCHEPDSLANLLIEVSRKYKKPMVISVNAGHYYQEFISILEGSGLPVYKDIRSAIKSLDAFVTYHVAHARKP